MQRSGHQENIYFVYIRMLIEYPVYIQLCPLRPAIVKKLFEHDFVKDCPPPSLPTLPIGTASKAGGPQRGGPNGPPLLPAAEDVCSSEW